MTDIQASIGLPQLDRLEEILARRREVATRFTAALADHPLLEPPGVPPGLEPNWQSYQVSLRPGASMARNEVMDRLFDLGVPTRRGVMASHLEPPYRRAPRLPITEAVAAATLQLPIHPGLSTRQLDHITAALWSLTR
jgi:dTDP-4-amino-4,6-dideoxygalactose transaminase